MGRQNDSWGKEYIVGYSIIDSLIRISGFADDRMRFGKAIKNFIVCFAFRSPVLY